MKHGVIAADIYKGIQTPTHIEAPKLNAKSQKLQNGTDIKIQYFTAQNEAKLVHAKVTSDLIFMSESTNAPTLQKH